MFVGRSGELQLLLDAFKEKRSATLLYGKRRVGKTTLIKEALEKQQKTYVYYECLRGTMRNNIDGLAQELTRLKILTFATTFTSFQDVFAFTYVYKNQSALQMLGAEVFYDQYIAPTLTEYISRRFEELCRDYFSYRARQGKLPGIRHIGSFYYDDPATKSNGEFDVALDFGDTYTICEAKYFKKPMEPDDIHREAGQIRGIKGIDVAQIGFISASGFAQKEDGYLYYTGDDLYAD